MKQEELIKKLKDAGFTDARIVKKTEGDWLIAEPDTLLDELAKILQEASIGYSDITTYARSVIARDVRDVGVSPRRDEGKKSRQRDDAPTTPKQGTLNPEPEK